MLFPDVLHRRILDYVLNRLHPFFSFDNVSGCRPREETDHVIIGLQHFHFEAVGIIWNDNANAKERN